MVARLFGASKNIMEVIMTIKIHISRDFSFAEFDAEFDPHTGEGLPTAEDLARIFDRLPAKDTQPIGANGLRPTPDTVRRQERREERRAESRKEPPATAAQRRTLERYGEWEEGMSKSEASAALTRLGF